MYNSYSSVTSKAISKHAYVKIFYGIQLESRGVHLYLKLHIILVKKIHVIRVVFQDQVMYARTLFRGAKLEKKGVFLVILTNFGKGMTVKLRKTHARMHI